MAAEWSVTARWVLPIDQPPLEGGRVVIKDDRIVAIEPRGSADLDLGDAAVLPGFVNAHTHLDLTGMRGLAPPSPDFTGWLRKVIAHRRGLNSDRVRSDIQNGLAESLRLGTTLIGDISGDGTSWEVLSNGPIRAVIFRELFGLKKDRVQEVAKEARTWLETHSPTPICWPGLSPHAPYSTHQFLYWEVTNLAAEFDVPLATHLAESSAELELLTHRTGPFREFLTELGVWEQGAIRTHPAHYIQDIRKRRSPDAVLYIHGNYLSPSIAILDSSTVVYCPRTHAAFGHPPHPFREFLKRGVRVALGTDSLASNPDLSVLAEARFIHQLDPDLPGETVLRMATLSGAEALAWADETGSLTPGKSADLVVIPVASGVADPYRAVLAGEAPVQAVLSRGQWLSLEWTGSG